MNFLRETDAFIASMSAGHEQPKEEPPDSQSQDLTDVCNKLHSTLQSLGVTMAEFTAEAKDYFEFERSKIIVEVKTGDDLVRSVEAAADYLRSRWNYDGLTDQELENTRAAAQKIVWCIDNPSELDE